jgi:hypothetical protein
MFGTSLTTTLAAKPLFYEYKWPHENIAHKFAQAHNDDMDLQENTGADEYLNTKQTEHTNISVVLVCRSGKRTCHNMVRAPRIRAGAISEEKEKMFRLEASPLIYCSTFHRLTCTENRYSSVLCTESHSHEETDDEQLVPVLPGLI